MDHLTIGELARSADVNKETIRYYERRGLIPEPPRTGSGYRQYSRETISRVRFIKRAQGLGFSLKEIMELLSLKVDQNTTCRDIKNIAEIKVPRIEDRIRSLQGMKKALEELIDLCSDDGSASECPIIDILDNRSGLGTRRS